MTSRLLVWIGVFIAGVLCVPLPSTAASWIPSGGPRVPLAVNENGQLAPFGLDTSGNLLINTAGGAAVTSVAGGWIAGAAPQVMLGVLPNGSFAPFSLDVNGNLEVTCSTCSSGGSGGGSGGSGGSSAGIAYDPDIGTAFATGAWVRPALSSLSWLSQSTATATDVSGGPLILAAGGGSYSTRYTSLLEALPSSGTVSWTKTWLLTIDTGYVSYSWGGVGIYDPTSNTMVIMDVLTGTGSGLQFDFAKVGFSGSGASASYSSYSSIYRWNEYYMKNIYFRISYNASTTYYTFSWSANGLGNFHFITTNPTSYLGISPASFACINLNPQFSTGVGQDNGMQVMLWSETTSTP